jgi:hypothetical protein
LALGAEIQFFPEEAAARLARHRLFELFDYFDEYLTSYGYLFAQDFATRLITIVRHKNYDQLLAPLVGQSFQSPDSLHCAFQAALVGEIEFMKDESSELCVSALLFAANDDFENVVGRGQKVARPGSRDLDREELWRGGSLRRDDAAILADRVRQLTRWKLNFLIQTVDSRFWELMQTLATSAGLIPRDSIPGFLDGVRDLVGAWGHLESRPRVARASG